ncbi:MAG: prepilin-type N-terminal cleavage/methylation domain-containing protein [Phycisphaerales bacterium]|nr:prepilin-type N-terminal cleavage/methylation domain-containing protein [Phycisphaerales bacterium]
MKTGRAAFTLIELLVVVAIIALLISILLPALNGARRQGRQTVCLTNMRSMGHAAMLYAQANRETVVRAENQDGRMHFVAMLQPYLDQQATTNELWDPATGRLRTLEFQQLCARTKILQCPDFPEPAQVQDYVVNAFVIPYPIRPSDWISGTVGPGPVNEARDTRRAEFTNLGKLGRVSPTELIYVTEAHALMPAPPSGNWGVYTDVFIANHMPLALQPRIANDDRHPGGITAMYFDGRGAIQKLRKIDPGAPYTLRDRIRKFTYDANEPVQ